MPDNAPRDSRLIGGIYRSGQVIASSGILTSYTAYNRNTNDIVGLFVLTLPSTMDLYTAQQLLEPLECRRLVVSSHVLHVYDWGIDGSRAYIATDPPRGVTLRYVLDNEDVDMQRALDCMRQMTYGLMALHEQGITGIDLRPQLVTVDSAGVADRVQLDDIGLRPILHKLGHTGAGYSSDIAAIDPRYSAPESIQGTQVGPWSDIYQLGLLLFELVTGRLPFVGRNPAETGVLQCTSPVPRMQQYKHDAPPALQDIADRALAKNPAGRFPDAQALLAALDAVQLPARILANIADTPTIRQAPQHTTNEMPALEEDITLRATLLTGDPSSPSTTDELSPKSTTGEYLSTAEENAYAYFCYEPAGAEPRRFAITKTTMIVGRLDPKRRLTPDIDLTALDPKMTVSRQHARISYEGTFFYIEDLKSHNKTRLGELTLQPLKPELLQHGDTVQFGSVRLVFRVRGMRDKPVLK